MYTFALSTAQCMSIALLLFLYYNTYNAIRFRKRIPLAYVMFESPEKRGDDHIAHITWSLLCNKFLCKFFPSKSNNNINHPVKFWLPLWFFHLEVPLSPSNSKQSILYHFFQHSMCHASVAVHKLLWTMLL